MRLQKFIAICILITVVFSCKKKSSETDNLFKFKNYISYTTSGRVSVAEPIEINLADAVEGWQQGQEITDNIVSIKPNVSGKLMVKNEHALNFISEQALKPDTEYSVSVKLNKIYPDIPSDFKTYTFQFKTITPNFNLATNNLQSYSKEWQYIGGTVKSADIISLDAAKKLIEASQNGKKLSVEWNESYQNSKVFEFKIDSINRLIEDSKVLVKWNGKSISADNSGENTITIPGINNFTITKVDVVQTPEQYLSINFSDPIKKQQNFDGLVTIQNTKNPKFIVDGNVLKVYPDSKIVGTIQVDVFQGIKNAENYKLKKPFSELVAFEDIKPEVRLVGNGTILPNSQELKFNFEAVNLKAVDVRIIKIFEE